MNRVLRFAVAVPKTCVRQSSTTVRSDLAKIRKKQAIFQAPNDDPVYLKGGSWDYVVFYTATALVFIGLGGSIHSVYKMATKN